MPFSTLSSGRLAENGPEAERAAALGRTFSTLSSGRLAENRGGSSVRSLVVGLSVPSLRVGWLKTDAGTPCRPSRRSFQYPLFGSVG